MRRRLALVAALLALGCSTTTGTPPRVASSPAPAASSNDTLRALRVPDPNHLLPPLVDSQDYGAILGPLRISSVGFGPDGKEFGLRATYAGTDDLFPQDLTRVAPEPIRVLDLRGGSVRQVDLPDLAVGQEVVAWSSVCSEGRRGPCNLVAVAILGGPVATPTPPGPSPVASATVSPPK